MSDDFGGGGMRFGGFGRIPSQRVNINESEELGELVAQYKKATAIIFTLLVFLYVSTNLMFGLEDWRQVVIGIEVILSVLVSLYIRRILIERFDGWDILGDSRGTYLSTNTAIAFLCGLAILLYVGLQATDFLVILFRFPDNASIEVVLKSVARTSAIFFTIALIAPTVAIVLRLVVREIPDQYHGNVDALQNRERLALDWAKFHEDNHRHWGDVIEQEPVPQIAAPQYTPLIRKTNVAILSAPTSEEERMDIAREEFLDGLRDGLFKTEERSWKGIRLVRSGYDLTAIGDRIRNDLLTDGWAEWQHPTKKNLGWKLLEEPDEIKAKWLIKRSRENES